MLERNPQALVDIKRVVRKVERIYKDYERLWRKRDKSMS